jgi:hypothetical protein
MSEQTPTPATGSSDDSGDPNSARLTLYVVGQSPNSRRASNNLLELARKNPELFKHLEIEVVDALQTPERVFEDLILLTPALLVRTADGSIGRIFGDLSDPGALLAALAGGSAAGVSGVAGVAGVAG